MVDKSVWFSLYQICQFLLYVNISNQIYPVIRCRSNIISCLLVIHFSPAINRILYMYFFLQSTRLTSLFLRYRVSNLCSRTVPSFFFILFLNWIQNDESFGHVQNMWLCPAPFVPHFFQQKVSLPEETPCEGTLKKRIVFFHAN